MSVAEISSFEDDRPLSNRFVIAGGPGTGKSTLLRALTEAGENCYAEISRLLIRRRLSEGSAGVPWADLNTFAEDCSRQMLQQLESGTHRGRCFFDRGLPDLIGYLNHAQRVAPAAWRIAARGYAGVVFFAPPWREIYVNDPERPQSFAEAQELSVHIRHAYLECGFRLIELERVSVRDRVRQVLQVVETYEQGSRHG